MKEIITALEAAIALGDKDHALADFDWGKSCLRAEDIRELNELPGQLRRALSTAKNLQKEALIAGLEETHGERT